MNQTNVTNCLFTLLRTFRVDFRTRLIRKKLLLRKSVTTVKQLQIWRLSLTIVLLVHGSDDRVHTSTLVLSASGFFFSSIFRSWATQYKFWGGTIKKEIYEISGNQLNCMEIASLDRRLVVHNNSPKYIFVVRTNTGRTWCLSALRGKSIGYLAASGSFIV